MKTELGKNERGKLKINLLHVVPRRSLHVAFRSSTMLPENRNLRPPDMSRYIHGKMGGSMNRGERMSERMMEESLLVAMMP